MPYLGYDVWSVIFCICILRVMDWVMITCMHYEQGSKQAIENRYPYVYSFIRSKIR